MIDHPLLLFCPFPTVHSDGTLADGTMLEQTNYCRAKCREKQCSNMPARAEEGRLALYTCGRGYSVVVFRMWDFVVRINGVVEASTNTAPKSFKKQNASRKLKLNHLNGWLQALDRVDPLYADALEAKAKDAIHALHDIKSLIGSILTTAELYIDEQDGRSISEKIEKSPEHLQTIYHSCEILQSLLQITDILTNPAVAKYDKPRPVSVHKIILKLVKIHQNRADSVRRRIHFRGESYNQVMLHGSFILIPHILIDNAIKHADPASDIVITIRDWKAGDISVKCSSFGELVPEEERSLIFNRAFRGSNARAKGSGLGLYIAQLVAEANGFTLSYKGTRRGVLGANKGNNDFTFVVPQSGAKKGWLHQSEKTRSLSQGSIYG